MREMVVPHEVRALGAFACAGSAEDEENCYVGGREGWGVFLRGTELRSGSSHVYFVYFVSGVADSWRFGDLEVMMLRWEKLEY